MALTCLNVHPFDRFNTAAVSPSTVHSFHSSNTIHVHPFDRFTTAAVSLLTVHSLHSNNQYFNLNLETFLRTTRNVHSTLMKDAQAVDDEGTA